MTAQQAASDIRHTLGIAQKHWARTSVASRLRIVRRFRKALRLNTLAMIRLIPGHSALDVLTAEILPLSAAARFLCLEARSILGETHLGPLGRPIWLSGIESRVIRRPLGTVLVLAPGNYPLMLAAIQTLQAIVAGNCVAIKPAPGAKPVLDHFAFLLERAGLPKGVVVILDEDQGEEAVACGFDLIILTGSARTGRLVAAAAAKTLTPTIMELSGADPVFVLPSADLDLVTRALHFGMTLKGGHTCIAPRRIFIERTQSAAFKQKLDAVFGAQQPGAAEPPVEALATLARSIRAAGGEARYHGNVCVFFIDQSHADLVDRDLFAPWFAVITVESIRDGLEIESKARHALGASIFGDEIEARAVARSIPAGTITINDLIVPSADPRLPFGGAGESGYGVTRGREGLLALTRPTSLSCRRRSAFHLLPAIRRWHAR